MLPILLFLSFGLPGNAQKTTVKNVRPAAGKLKIRVPSGIIGDHYWIYLDGHLKSGPPHGTPARTLNIVMLADGSNWEAWSPEGRVMSSKQYDTMIDSYLASGDKHHIFQTFEYPVSPGTHTVEVVVSIRSGTGRSLPPLPFVITRKHQVSVQSNQTIDVYPEVPPDWNNFLPNFAAPPATGSTLCTRPSFDLKKVNSDFLQWGNSYQNNQLVKLLHAAKGSFTPEAGVVVLDLADGSREFDGTQIELIADQISKQYSGGDFTLKEIAVCKNRFPQYPKVFAEYDKTISFIEDDIASFYKLAADLKERRE